MPAPCRLPHSINQPASEGEAFEAVVARVKPSCMIGLAGAGRLFTPKSLQ